MPGLMSPEKRSELRGTNWHGFEKDSTGPKHSSEAVALHEDERKVSV